MYDEIIENLETIIDDLMVEIDDTNFKIQQVENRLMFSVEQVCRYSIDGRTYASIAEKSLVNYEKLNKKLDELTELKKRYEKDIESFERLARI